jgi:hypothetical protein
MSRRRLEPLFAEPDDDEFDEEDELDPLDEVEYFVEVDDEESSVLSSVPKSVHSSQTSSSAPSILTRLGDETSVPHISH